LFCILPRHAYNLNAPKDSIHSLYRTSLVTRRMARVYWQDRMSEDLVWREKVVNTQLMWKR
jgi:hypothetical protein